MCRLEACPDDGRSVVVDLEVISPDPSGFGEGFTVSIEVRGLCPDNPNQVVRPNRFIVRDLQYQRGNSLPQSCEVRVRRLIGDGLEVIERRQKLRDNLVRSHHAPAKMVGGLYFECRGAGVFGLT